MGTQAPTRDLRGFIVPWPYTVGHIWETQAVYTQGTARAGTPEAGGSYKLNLQTAGTQTAKIVVQTQRGGHAAKATFCWKEYLGNYYGKQQNNVVTHWETIAAGSATVEYDVLDSFTGIDGTSFVAAKFDEGAGTYGLKVWRRSTSDGTWTSATLYTTTIAALTAKLFAGICQLEDDSIICAHWVRKSTGDKTQLRVLRTTDNGTTWNLISSEALRVPVDTAGTFGAGAPGYDVDRIRLRAQNGQVLLIAQLFAHNTSLSNTDIIAQYGSISQGSSFTEVEKTSGTIRYFQPDLILSHDGQFLVPYIASVDSVKVLFLSSAFTPVSSAQTLAFSNLDVVSGVVVAQNVVNKHLEFGNLSAYETPGGRLYICISYFSGSDEGIFEVTSENNGRAWSMMSAGTNGRTAALFTIQTVGLTAKPFAATWNGGGALLAHNWTSPYNFDKSIGIMYAGGYSQVTFPPLNDYNRYYESTRPEFLWLATCLAGDPTPLTAAGTGTETLNSGFSFVSTNTTQTKHYSYTMASSASLLSRGFICRLSFRAITGGTTTTADRAIVFSVANGTGTDYSATIYISPTEIRAVDNVSTANIGSPLTIDTTVRTDILFTMNGGKCSVWARTTASDKSQWRTIGEGVTISSTAGAGVSRVQWGHITAPAAGTVTTNFYEFWISSDTNVGIPSLAYGQSVEELSALPYPPRGFYQYINGGMYITTSDGPAFESEQYTIDIGYDYPIDKIFPKVSPTPSVTWRTEPDTRVALQPEVFLPLWLDKTIQSTANGDIGSPLVAFHLDNINFKDYKIERYDQPSASWVVMATIENKAMQFNFSRQGASISCTDATGAYIFLDEFANSRIELVGGTTVYRKIRSNVEGTLSTAVTKTGKLFLDDVQTTDPTTGVAKIIPNQSTVIIEDSAPATAYGIRILTQETREGYFEIGMLVAGTVIIPGRQYSRGRQIEFAAGVEQSEQQDGITRQRKTGEGKRTLSIAWTDGVDISQLSEAIADPDYLIATTGSPSTNPVAALNDVPDLMMGLNQLVNGSQLPVVYIPRIDVRAYSGSPTVWQYPRRREKLLCRLTSDISIEHVVGDELVGANQKGEVFRVATATFEEVI